MFYMDYDNASVKRAIAKAAAKQMDVLIVEHGKYSVNGSHSYYNVVVYWNDYEEVVVECDCPTSSPNACYHGVAAAQAFLDTENEMAESAAA